MCTWVWRSCCVVAISKEEEEEGKRSRSLLILLWEHCHNYSSKDLLMQEDQEWQKKWDEKLVVSITSPRPESLRVSFTFPPSCAGTPPACHSSTSATPWNANQSKSCVWRSIESISRTQPPPFFLPSFVPQAVARVSTRFSHWEKVLFF